MPNPTTLKHEENGFRFAIDLCTKSGKELVQIFGTCDLDSIFELPYSEIKRKVTEYETFLPVGAIVYFDDTKCIVLQSIEGKSTLLTMDNKIIAEVPNTECVKTGNKVNFDKIFAI